MSGACRYVMTCGSFVSKLSVCLGIIGSLFIMSYVKGACRARFGASPATLTCPRFAPSYYLVREG